MARGDPQVVVRLPDDVKAFIKAEATINTSSQNSEIVRAIRERMARIGPAGAATPPGRGSSNSMEEKADEHGNR